MSKIVEFKISKGVTVELDKNQWRRKSLELTVQMPPKHTDEEVQVALTHAEYILDTWLGQPETKRAPVTEPSKVTVNQVKAAFPAQLTDMLMFKDTPEHVVIKPRQFLGSENFSKIAAVVRDQLGGEYISAGKESHFRVPKTEAEFEPAPQFNPEDLMKHEGWKGKKDPDHEGEYKKGSLNFGWDFRDKFNPEVIKVLEESGGSITIGQHQFTLTNRIVQTKKVKI